MCIGLGGGSTIGYLAEYLAKEERKITVVTPSDDTAELCKNLGLMVLSLEMTDYIDIAFDGCDELDKELNALEASMRDSYKGKNYCIHGRKICFVN